MSKFDIKTFFADIASLDQTAESLLFGKSDVPYQDIAYASKKLWFEPLETLFNENIAAIKSDPNGIQSFLDKTYSGYISPLFLIYISTVSFNVFPYAVSEKVFRTFIKKLRSSTTASESTKTIEAFRKKNLDPHQDYTFRQIFRPYHPLHYLLADLHKSLDYTFDIDASLVVKSLCPYLIFPNNKLPKDVLFSLGLTAGISMSELLSLTDVHRVDTWTVKCNGTKYTLLFPATDWIRAWRFLHSCSLPLSLAHKKTTLDIPHKVIGIRLPYKLIPALHSCLVERFHGTPSSSKSIASFNISNVKNPTDIVQTYSTSCAAEFEHRLTSLPMDVAKKALMVRNHISKDPSTRLTGDKIHELVDVNQQQTKMINDLFWAVFSPISMEE